MNARFSKNDYREKIQFYLNELQATNNRFGNRVAVERDLKCRIGHTYEGLATYGLGDSPTEGGDPKERAEMFEQAVMWYQAAEETTGYYSDFIFRQVEASWGAAHFRKKAGLDDVVTQAFLERGATLFSLALNGRDIREVMFLDGPIPDYLRQKADVLVDSGALKAGIFRDHSKDHQRN
jgi:hypothetical protein